MRLKAARTSRTLLASTSADLVDRGTPAAQVVRINPAGAAGEGRVGGPRVRCRLTVVLSQERHAELRLRAGDAVFVFPKRAEKFLDICCTDMYPL